MGFTYALSGAKGYGSWCWSPAQKKAAEPFASLWVTDNDTTYVPQLLFRILFLFSPFRLPHRCHKAVLPSLGESAAPSPGGSGVGDGEPLRLVAVLLGALSLVLVSVRVGFASLEVTNAPSATVRKDLGSFSSRPPSSESLAAGVEAPDAEHDANGETGVAACAGAEETWMTIVGNVGVGDASAASPLATTAAAAAVSAPAGGVDDLGNPVRDVTCTPKQRATFVGDRHQPGRQKRRRITSLDRLERKYPAEVHDFLLQLTLLYRLSH